MKTVPYLKLPKDELKDSTFASDYFVISTNLSNKEVLHIAEAACNVGKRLILNSLPDKKIQRKLLRYISVAVLSEQEISELTKVDVKDLESVKIAALRLYGRGAEAVIIRMETGKVLVFADETFSLVDSLEYAFSLVIGKKNDLKAVCQGLLSMEFS